MKKFNFLYLVLILLVLLTIGCQKDVVPPSDNNTFQKINGQGQDIFFVPDTVAKYLAQRMSKHYLDTDTPLPNSPLRQINNVIPIKDQNNKTAIYIINFSSNNGYVVLSADYRYHPLLTWSDTGNFDTSKVMPSMLAEWYTYTVESIEMLRSNQVDNRDRGYAGWISTISLLIPEYTGRIWIRPMTPNDMEVPEMGYASDCHAPFWIKEEKTPLIRTEWGQI